MNMLERATELFNECVERLGDSDFDEPCLLPGWSRRHVIAHVHSNAKALRRLVRWARTGEATPMYRSARQRTAEIESGARLPVIALRSLVRVSAETLAAELESLPEAAWDNEVVTAQGRTVRAREIVWMRTREVAVHAIDLDVGVRFADLPGDLLAALLADSAAKRAGGPEGAPLAAWLTGRTTDVPTLTPWL